jgi:Ca2+/Na+ antiporter
MVSLTRSELRKLTLTVIHCSNALTSTTFTSWFQHSHILSSASWFANEKLKPIHPVSSSWEARKVNREVLISVFIMWHIKLQVDPFLAAFLFYLLLLFRFQLYCFFLSLYCLFLLNVSKKKKKEKERKEKKKKTKGGAISSPFKMNVLLHVNIM